MPAMDSIRCDGLAEAANVSFSTEVIGGEVVFRWFAVCGCGDTVITGAADQDTAEQALEDHRARYVWTRHEA